ncbi:MAG: hypothetical protein HQM14_19470 [SAR324 cluster bacterium]|nr:hypothetical protein [SAR324 cluster bacterium]
MSLPIQISLAGDGRVVLLTPQTVRKAFFQFSNANLGYSGRRRFRLDRPFKGIAEKKHLTCTKQVFTILDALHRNRLALHHDDIQFVEDEINRHLIAEEMALVEMEGQLFEGCVFVNQPAKNQEKVKYVLRYGLIFIIEPIQRDRVLKSKNFDLFLQDHDFKLHLVRFLGMRLNSSQSRIVLLFRNRLDLSITWTSNMDQFRPRQIFKINKTYPCPGFQLLP